jgi:hypothetical protein
MLWQRVRPMHRRERLAVTRRYFGNAGHFVASSQCRFHLHTHVGRFCVSSVGDYYPRGATDPERIGCDRFYETFVFELGDDDEIASYTEIDASDGYDDADAANAGHEAMVQKYEAKS